MNTPSLMSQQSINILAFDTSTDVGTLALWAHGKMHTMTLPLGEGVHSQAACLIPTIQDLLYKNNIGFQDLHVIATTKGPGSFTGIRIAISTLQGLASATPAKVYLPTTFEVAAHKACSRQVDVYLITISTKRDSFYAQPFDQLLRPLSDGKIMTETQMNDFLSENMPIKRFDYTSCGHAEDIVRLYQHNLTTSENETVSLKRERLHFFTPYYLHNPEFVKQKPCSL